MRYELIGKFRVTTWKLIEGRKVLKSKFFDDINLAWQYAFKAGRYLFDGQALNEPRFYDEESLLEHLLNIKCKGGRFVKFGHLEKKMLDSRIKKELFREENAPYRDSLERTLYQAL